MSMVLCFKQPLLVLGSDVVILLYNGNNSVETNENAE